MIVARLLATFDELENDPKAAIPPAGSSGPKAATFPPSPGTFPIRVDQADCAASGADSKAAIPPTGSANATAADSAAQVPSEPPPLQTSKARVSSAGRRSQCETYLAVIQAKLDQQLSAQWDSGKTSWRSRDSGGKYDSVKRPVRRLIQRQPLPFRRMEVPPGEEAQVDFGSGAWVVAPDRQDN